MKRSHLQARPCPFPYKHPINLHTAFRCTNNEISMSEKQTTFLTSMRVENGGPINTKNYSNDVNKAIYGTTET